MHTYIHTPSIHPYLSNILKGRSSSVGIATDYGLDGLGSNPGGDEIFRPSRPALVPSLLNDGYRIFPGVEGAGAGADPHPHLELKVLEKRRAIPLLTPRACVAYKKGENLPT